MRFLNVLFLVAVTAAIRDNRMEGMDGMGLKDGIGYQSQDGHDQSHEVHSNELDPTLPKPTLEPVPEPVPHVEHMHVLPILQTQLAPEELAWWTEYSKTKSYFDLEGTGFLYGHMLLVWASFIFIYPISMVCNNVKSWDWHLASLFLHTVSVGGGIISYWIFVGNSSEEIYPGNAYDPMTWLLFIANIATLIFAIIRYSYVKLGGDQDYEQLNDIESGETETLFGNLTDFDLTEEFNSENQELKTSKSAMLSQPRFAWICKNKVINKLISIFGTGSSNTFSILQWIQFIYYLVYLPTGVAIFLNLGKSNTVFNLLAHFIKGGVFVVYGMATLARYCGAWSNKGWAWNNKYITTKALKTRWNRIQFKGLFTMEMIECSLILFYGTTNIFLEHLANWGKPYSLKDLQHASIAFIFIGCGLGGVLVELKLSSWRYEKAIEQLNDDLPILKASPGFSPNPFPVLAIYWTGYLMSKHMQSLAVSTEIHTQWGNMFIMACAFRLISYILSTLIVPQKSHLTQARGPFTELLVSIGLICGGLIFMESSEPVIHIFEYHGFTSMFTLNISLGVVALFMAWEMTLFTLRDWLRAKIALKS